MSTVLVTGGAGYIGSHACKTLRNAGYTPVVFDNFSTGWREAVKFGDVFEGDLLNKTDVDAAFKKHRPTAVMHFAALSQVGESMEDPGKYWHENVTGAVNLAQAAVDAECKNFVFSSTCATFGDQDGVVLTEDTPQYPINAYGGSKRAVEAILGDFSNRFDLNTVIFRYFNVAGADPDGEIGEFHQPETHLIPLMLDAIDGKRPALTVFGTDYPTPDGTCIRDYVHVVDLVDAHVKGLEWLETGGKRGVFNLGTGNGFSVREVIDASASVTNRQVPIIEGARRAGDATKLVSGSNHAAKELQWTPARSTMKSMIADAWRWHQNGGYSQ